MKIGDLHAAAGAGIGQVNKLIRSIRSVIFSTRMRNAAVRLAVHLRGRIAASLCLYIARMLVPSPERVE